MWSLSLIKKFGSLHDLFRITANSQNENVQKCGDYRASPLADNRLLKNYTLVAKNEWNNR